MYFAISKKKYKISKIEELKEIVNAHPNIDGILDQTTSLPGTKLQYKAWNLFFG
ncbi:hypothetical protein [Halobacillus sp. K22]|uniref:hypothetical protein n=1 Tax=Halobacillus sp. K22 TaxID=3457431 RepID=UPI003FCD9B52